MLEGLMQSYIFEKLDKQITDRIPYCMFISFLGYSISQYAKIGIGFSPLIIPAFLIVVFALANFRFNQIINAPLGNLLASLEFKDFVNSLRQVYRERRSLWDDVATAKGTQTWVSGLLSGVALSVFIVAILWESLGYFGIGIQVTTLLTFVLAVYLIYDATQSHLLEEPKTTDESALGFDVIEMYAVKNTMEASPMKSTALLYVVSRMVCPLVSVRLPTFNSSGMTVYLNEDLMEVLNKFADSTRGQNFYLKHEAGLRIEDFQLEAQQKMAEKITTTIGASPMQVFPYLFGKEAGDSAAQKKKWAAMRIQEKSGSGERTAGYVFINMYRGVLPKHVMRRVSSKLRTEDEFIEKSILSFILIGERSYIGYLKSEIELVSAKVPPEMLNTEMDLHTSEGYPRSYPRER